MLPAPLIRAPATLARRAGATTRAGLCRASSTSNGSKSSGGGGVTQAQLAASLRARAAARANRAGAGSTSAKDTAATGGGNKVWRNRLLTAGLVVFTGCAAATPFVISQRNKQRNHNLYSSKDALSGSAIQRGAFLNSGSRDAGPDPNWVNGTYIGKRNFGPPGPKRGDVDLGDKGGGAAARK